MCAHIYVIWIEAYALILWGSRLWLIEHTARFNAGTFAKIRQTINKHNTNARTHTCTLTLRSIRFKMNRESTKLSCQLKNTHIFYFVVPFSERVKEQERERERGAIRPQFVSTKWNFYVCKTIFDNIQNDFIQRCWLGWLPEHMNRISISIEIVCWKFVQMMMKDMWNIVLFCFLKTQETHKIF